MQAASAALTVDGPALHIIECSKRKIWDTGAPSVPRFVPAKQAYRGEAITSWLRDPRASKERWLILSARHGFIDPDQPIENYDVTFSLPATGPITDDALAAQVQRQVRWADAVPIRQFTRVIVHGHKIYFDRVVSAFSGVGAQVEHDDQPVDSEGQPARGSSGRTVTPASGPAVADPPAETARALMWSVERARAIGLALAQLPSQVFEDFDRAEPEWPLLERLATWSDGSLACLTAICLGITDYQLGTGATAGYWKAAMTEVDRRAPAKSTEVIDLMARVCTPCLPG